MARLTRNQSRVLNWDRRAGQRACDIAQISILAFIAALYLVAPRAADADERVGWTLPILVVHLLATVFRLVINSTAKPSTLREFVWVSVDFVMLYAVVFSYHLQYGQPPGIILKSTTAGMAFFLVAIRAVLADVSLLIFAGTAAAAGWVALSAYAGLVGGPESVTRSFVEYMTSSKILVGAQVEHILAIGLVTFALCVAVIQGRVDGLTGLRDRKAFLLRLERTAGKAGQHSGAILLAEVVNLHALSDSFGAETADAALVEIAGRLRQFTQGWAEVGRLEDSLFAVRSLGFIDDREIERPLRDLGLLLEAPLESARGFSFAILTAGAAGGSSADAVETLGNARAALNRAKAGKIREAVIYTPAIQQEARRRMALERDLRHAVQAEGLDVHYQPIVMLAAGRAVGAEALARWRHPELGDISPAEFIPIAESTGLITEIGRWVLARSIEDQAAWRRAGASEDIFVSVNVAPAQLQEWRTLEDALRVGRSVNARLRLEITEGAMAEHDQVLVDRIRQIDQAGFSLALDDFGAGYSSFGRLSSLPFSTLKVDRQLTLGIRDQSGRASLNAISQLARSLRMDTVVEGIEEEVERRWLHAMGFRLGQGYLFGKAMPSAIFATHLSPAAPTHRAAAQGLVDRQDRRSRISGQV